MKLRRFKLGQNVPTVILIYLLLIFFAASGRAVFEIYYANKPVVSSEKPMEKPVAAEITEPTPKKAEIRATADLPIPFTVQAPLNNWNIHDESCEEAGILMVHYYFQGLPIGLNGVINSQKANTELIAMKDWQVKHYGKEPDLNMPALGQFAKDYYGYNYEVKKGAVENDIKQAISDGNPVFLPVITHGLENSMYGRVPSYHVLLVRGYDATGVFANDSGVGNGQNHHYDWNIVWQAVDQQKTKMNQGRDIVIIKKD